MHEIAHRLATKLFDKPLIQNSFRSALVEEMIEPFFSLGGWQYVGHDWGGWDFVRLDGLKLEVKQSAARQSWAGKPSRGIFSIQPTKGYYEGSSWIENPGRQADVYVFAWNGSSGDETDHRNQAQWEFYVVPAANLEEAQVTIALSRVRELALKAGQDGPVAINELLSRINSVLA